VSIITEGPICRDVVEGCESMNNSEIWCESPGAAVDYNNNSISCLWLEGNANSELNISGSCILKVLIFSLLLLV
jgi:hypothetical protein